MYHRACKDRLRACGPAGKHRICLLYTSVRLGEVRRHKAVAAVHRAVVVEAARDAQGVRLPALELAAERADVGRESDLRQDLPGVKVRLLRGDRLRVRIDVGRVDVVGVLLSLIRI